LSRTLAFVGWLARRVFGGHVSKRATERARDPPHDAVRVRQLVDVLALRCWPTRSTAVERDHRARLAHNNRKLRDRRPLVATAGVALGADRRCMRRVNATLYVGFCDRVPLVARPDRQKDLGKAAVFLVGLPRPHLKPDSAEVRAAPVVVIGWLGVPAVRVRS